MEFVNLTPHSVQIYQGDEMAFEFPASGLVARVAESTTKDEPAGQVPVTLVELGEVLNLPAPKAGTSYIVSMPTAMALRALGIDRADCLYPFGQVRDDQGRICGCRGLAIIV